MRQSRQQNLVVGNASVQFLPPNPKRRSLVISTDTHPIYVSEYHTATALNGLCLFNAQIPTVLCCKDTGNWITKALTVIAPAGSTNVSIIEVSADPFGDVEDHTLAMGVEGTRSAG